MNLTWITSEWKNIFRNRKNITAFIVILFIPLLYSGTYLWANWNPYAHLKRLPVAVINDDVITHYNGKTFGLGDILVEELKENKSFK